MSASAKPTEKLFKSFLAAVLAISLCPLMPADKAQAEETGDSGEQTDAAQVPDESLGGDVDPTESALAASNSDADLELAGENNGAEDEGAPDDSNVALQAASDSGTPIVNWTECGTCQWMIDSSGCLIIEPQSGESGELEDWGWTAPWSNYKNSIISATIKKTVIAKTTQKAFYGCESLRSIDLSGLDTSKVTDMTSMFDGCSKLASLDLSSFDTSKVASMSSMFYRCSKLSSLDLSGLDTSKVTSMSGMFYGCSSLKSLDLSSFDTSKVTSMYCMFQGCSSLASLDLSSFDTSNVISMCPEESSHYDEGMFSGCSSLSSLDLSSFDTSNVTGMDGMFSGCSKLATLDLSSFNTSNVKGYSGYHSMSEMFSGCSSLTSLDLSSFDTSSVRDMTDMFYDCSKLASLDLSSFDTSNVTGMSRMFSGCSKLAALDLSSFNTSNVKGDSGFHRGMSEMFSGCSSLVNLDLSSFDTSNVRDMSRMFDGCLRLETLNFSSFNAESVDDMGSMFEGCQSLKTISFPAVLNTPKVTNFSGMFSDCRSLEGLDVSGFDTSAAKSLSSMFSGCTKLAALDVSNFDTSAATSLNWMFYGCESLRSLDLSGFDTSAADYRYGLSGFLDGCKSLRTVTLGPKFSFEGAGLDRQCSLPAPSGDGLTGRWVNASTGVAYAPDSIPSNTKATYTAQATESFEGWSQNGGCIWRVDDKGCLTVKPLPGAETGQLGEWLGDDAPWRSQTSAIKSVVIEKGVIAGQRLDCMFSGCSNLVSADLSGLSTSSTTSMESMFRGCTSLESLDISRFDTSKVTNMFAMFNNCPSLESLDLSSFDTSNVTTMWVMFGGCSSLKTLTFSSRFDTSNVENMDMMFAGCTALTALDVSGFNTSKAKTMRYMFSNCKSLTSLDVSSFDTSKVIGNSGPQYGPTGMDGMFNRCSSLISLDLSSFDTSKVTNLSKMFSGCSSLVFLDLSGFCTSNVMDMSDMFQGCGKLESLDLSSFDTSKVTNLSKMFSGCSSVGSLNLGSFSTAVVSDMSSMFDGCSSLASLDISHFDTSSASNMANMFWNCSSLRSVALGEKFSFRGAKNARQCSLPKLKGDGLTAFWENAETHELYAEDEIPNNVAATYTAQTKGEASKIALSESMFTVDTGSRTYTGSPIEPSVSSVSLRRGADYSVAYGENVNAGEGTILITGAGNYTGQVTYSFRIDPIQVDAPKAAADLVYSGAEQVGVAPSDDYEVAGGSATNAGDYTAAVSLKDKRNYVWAGEGGSDDVRVPWSIAKAVPSYSAPEPVDATLGQTLGGLELPGGFSWQDDPSTSVGNAGEHEFMATFTPSDEANYNVVQNIPVIVRVSSPNLVVVPQVADLVYTGEFQKAAVPESDFYAIEEVCGGIDAGAYEVKLSLKDSSSCRWADDGSNSEKTVTYRILPAQLTDATITGVPARMEATGSQLTPKPIVTFKGKTLTQGADYSLSYGENVNPGKGSVTVTAIGGGNFTGSATVEFDIEKKAVPAPVFSDVDYSDTSWYGDAVTFVAEKGLITGYTDGVKAGQFGVGDVLTRAQLATILWRNACPDEYASYDPETAKDTTGIDGSADGMYYTAAANWAVKNGVITGFDREDGSKDFAADENVSFEQLVTILARLCATPEELSAAGSDLSAFADGDLASSWSRGAFAWAAAKGLVQGYDEPTGKYLRPGDPVARERVAVVLMRAFEMGIMK
ncbi:BspA family leucine-rich repeat surface protein [Ellagibacter isourolithinifaciens]|uniref:BspA family leucine-rich repeat surface protein n=1 Tax=Ellagibacter isourolithinifaciens TaxID=2137581 RepID=UPI003A8F78CD